MVMLVKGAYRVGVGDRPLQCVAWTKKTTTRRSGARAQPPALLSWVSLRKGASIARDVSTQTMILVARLAKEGALTTTHQRHTKRLQSSSVSCEERSLQRHL
jgi:hypothetical protein